MRLGLRLSLAVCLLVVAACNRRPQPAPVVVVTPPSTLALDAADRAFAAADYSGAARDFQRYLELVPSGGERDHVLFHLGLIYALPDPMLQDWTRATGYLKNVVDEFPQSAHKPAAQLILTMRDQATGLSAEIAKLTAESNQLRDEGTRLRNEVTQLQTDAAQLRTNSTALNDQIARLKAEADRVGLELDKRDQRIRELTGQLERMIKIDSERRSRPNN